MITTAASAAAPGVWIPSDNALVAANADPETAQGANTWGAGIVYLVKLPLRTAAIITNLLVATSAAAVGASGGSFAGVYSSAGVLLGETADLAATLGVVNVVTMPLTSPVAAGPGFVWAALLANYATTQPGLRTSANAIGAVNAGLGASAYRHAVNGTAMTSLPPSFNPAANSLASVIAPWVGAS